MQLYTVYFMCKLLYMFQVVSPLIIRSINNSIYSIRYWPTAVATGLYRGGVETDLCVLSAAHTSHSQILHGTDRKQQRLTGNRCCW